VATTWHAKEAVRELYAHGDEATTREWIERLVTDMADRDNPVEVRSLRRTLARWTEHIVAWHPSHVSNGPTEAANYLTKRVKRAAFNFSSFRIFRVRALLYAGKPQVAPTRDHHIPLKSEAPLNSCSQICPAVTR
jgi:transposase